MPPVQTPLLQGRGLRRVIEDRVLFDNIDISLHEGETLLVTGPSGCGKSTLLRALAGLDVLAAGTLTLQGRPFARWGPTAWRAAVCLVPQQPPDSALTPAETNARIQQLLIHRGNTHVDPRPIAVEWGLAADRWMVPWSRLSGGERQRAALALALARHPTVLLLDEPTAALDATTAAAVERSLRGRSCVWVTHDAEQTKRVADRVWRL